MKPTLIVTADDVGLHPAVAAGAIAAHANGIVTACSVVAGGAALDDAIGRLAEPPGLGVGSHFTLTGARPVTDPHAVPSLLGSDGNLPGGVANPGADDHALASTFGWGYRWEQETAALCDPVARATLDRIGVPLRSPADLTVNN